MNTKWEMKKTFIQDKVAADQERLEKFLEDGWEPFAVTSSRQVGNTIWFKRVKKEPRYSDL